jgi:hypothetical protein
MFLFPNISAAKAVAPLQIFTDFTAAVVNFER